MNTVNNREVCVENLPTALALVEKTIGNLNPLLTSFPSLVVYIQELTKLNKSLEAWSTLEKSRVKEVGESEKNTIKTELHELIFGIYKWAVYATDLSQSKARVIDQLREVEEVVFGGHDYFD